MLRNGDYFLQIDNSKWFLEQNNLSQICIPFILEKNHIRDSKTRFHDKMTAVLRFYVLSFTI